MKVRGLILGAVAFGTVFFLERQFADIAKDLARYDAMRGMSGEPPLVRDMLGKLKTMISEFGTSDDGRDLIGSLTYDIVRYAQMRGM